MSEAWVLSVGQLNEYVRRTLASDPMLMRVQLRGEISNFKRHSSGHLYFSLKDDDARIACVMFKQYAFALSMRPADGMQVVLSGSVSLYVKDGQYQFYATQLRVDGVGDLFSRFEMLKKRLAEEGLFDASIKKSIPLLPRTIGVVTSPTGAVIQDIAHVSFRRNEKADILLYPAKVQGVGASDEIIKGIKMLNKISEVDVIIIARGGGSIEDLWAFNEEKLARAIRSSKKPVVSAVGHETDYTIADFASDLRAATPSAAAEMTVPLVSALQDQLQALSVRLTQSMQRQMNDKANRVKTLRMGLNAHHPSNMLRENALRLTHIRSQLDRAIHGIMQQKLQAVQLQKSHLHSISPRAVLARGYSMVMQEDRLISSVAQLNEKEQATIHMHDGYAKVQITQKVSEGNGSEEEDRSSNV